MNLPRPFAPINSASPLEAAKCYVEQGFRPVPIPYREKKPKLNAWPQLNLKGEELPKHFNSQHQNIGIILGDTGTCDVDCDTPEAVVAARMLLPETGMRFGHASKRASHYFYRSDPPICSVQYKDPIDKKMLVELRCCKQDSSIGLQTVVPPSI